MRILNNTAIAEANGEERAFGPLPVIEMEMVNVDELGWRVGDDPGYDTMWTNNDVPNCVPALFQDFFTLIYDEDGGSEHLNYDAEITLPFDFPSGEYYIKNVNDNNANLLYNVMSINHYDNDNGGTDICITLTNVT
jgi:hypothetical protein